MKFIRNVQLLYSLTKVPTNELVGYDHSSLWDEILNLMRMETPPSSRSEEARCRPAGAYEYGEATSHSTNIPLLRS
jgi:hypothetical protein